jgi:hypothetical protein
MYNIFYFFNGIIMLPAQIKDIIFFTGFGEKYHTPALYVNGVRFKRSDNGYLSDTYEDDGLFFIFTKELVASLGIQWQEKFTHIAFRLESHVDIPENLDEYEQVIHDFYHNFELEAFLDSLSWIWHRKEDAMYSIQRFYEYAGGDNNYFETWFAEYSKNHPDFFDLFEDELMMYHGSNHYSLSDEKRKAKIEAIDKKLRQGMRDILTDVYHSDKPLEPVRQNMLAPL